MISDQGQSSGNLLRWCDALSEHLLYGFAAYTLLYHVALLSRMSLGQLTALAAVGFVIYAGFSLNRSMRGFSQSSAPGPFDVKLALALMGLVAVCAALSLLTIRYDHDDVTYMARVVWNFEHASLPMRPDKPWAFVVNDGAIRLYSLPSYETLTASLALMLGVDPVWVYHYLVPILGGGFLPIAWFLVLRRLHWNDWACMFGVIAIVLLLCADGTNHRSLGNFSLTRIWQGKVLLIAIGTPLCVAYILDLTRGLVSRSALKLAALGVCAIGLTTTGIFYVPFLYAVVGLSAYAITSPRPRFRDIVFGAIALSVYPLACALWFLDSVLASMPASGERMAQSYPAEIGTMVELVYGSPWGLSLCVAYISLAILAVLKQWRLLAWLVSWAAITIAIFSVPQVTEWIGTHWAARVVSWRMLYALPVLVAVGLASTCLCAAHPLGRYLTTGLTIICSLAVSFLAVGNYPPSPWSNKLTEVVFPKLALKLPAEELTVARTIMTELEDGPMFSPERISRVLPVLTSRFPQFTWRLLVFVPGSASETEWSATRLLAGADLGPAAIEAFGEVIRKGFRYVVIGEKALESRQVKEVLLGAGFQLQRSLGHGLWVFERPWGYLGR